MALHEEQVQSDQRHGRQRQDHHVQGVEAGERVAADVVAAPGQQEQGTFPPRGPIPTIAVPTFVAKNAKLVPAAAGSR